MANIYDKASLVLIPSGTKEGVCFSQKPTNGDGDFTFSRASAATRVNSDGLIEKETQNLLLQSNQFDTTWTISGATLTSGQSGYDGSSDAWLLTKTSTNGRPIQNVSLSGVQSFSIYAKANASNWMKLQIWDGSVFKAVSFNLSDGSIGSLINLIDANIESVGNDWYRCSIIFTASTQTVYVYPAEGDNVTSGTSGSIYIQDAQLNQGLVADSYLETTTAAVYGGITDNIPRLDYTDSSCPSLLLEPQRTNLVTNSEYFDASSWSQYVFGGASLTRTFGYESPEGYNNAYKFDVVVGTGGVLLTDNITINPANAQTLSIWMKGQNGGEKVILALRNSGSEGASGDIMTLTSEWARYDVTLTTDAAVRGFQFRMLSSNGVVDQTIYVYGAQLEQGSYPTSYIPTYGASVTRLAEPNQLGKTDLISDGFFSSTELTWFIDIKLFEKDAGSSVAPRLVNSSNNQIFIGLNSTLGGNLNIRYKDGTTAANTSGVSFDENGQRFKVLVKVSGINGEAFINGSSMGTFTTLAASNYDEFENAFSNAYDLRQMLMFPTALTDQEAIDLTTL